MHSPVVAAASALLMSIGRRQAESGPLRSFQKELTLQQPQMTWVVVKKGVPLWESILRGI